MIGFPTFAEERDRAYRLGKKHARKPLSSDANNPFHPIDAAALHAEWAEGFWDGVADQPTFYEALTERTETGGAQ